MIKAPNRWIFWESYKIKVKYIRGAYSIGKSITDVVGNKIYRHVKRSSDSLRPATYHDIYAYSRHLSRMSWKALCDSRWFLSMNITYIVNRLKKEEVPNMQNIFLFFVIGLGSRITPKRLDRFGKFLMMVSWRNKEKSSNFISTFQSIWVHFEGVYLSSRHQDRFWLWDWGEIDGTLQISQVHLKRYGHFL